MNYLIVLHTFPHGSLQLQRTAETIDDLEQSNSQTIEKVADMEV
jgi:hypothetical protein